MEILIAAVLLTAGMMLGATVIDWTSRAKLRNEMQTAEKGLVAAAEKLSATHNSLAAGLQALQDQVNSHEFKLSGLGAKPQTWAARPGTA